MHRLLSWCGCLTLVVSCGCAVCASTEDSKFAAYGGLRQRTDMVHGRVASVFDPAPEVIHARNGEQSPRLAPADSVEDSGSTEGQVEPRVPGNGGADPGFDEPDTESVLPQLPNGTIELPELEPNGMPSFDGDPPQALPPDLPGSDRSAGRHPLMGLFDEGF